MEEMVRGIKTKFTKGPWIAGHLGSDSKCQCQSILAEGYMGCIATVEVDNGRPISDGGNDAPPLEEAVANMHLISAAPDLLKALTYCVLEIVAPSDRLTTSQMLALSTAQKAINKALGEAA